jgi:RNA polymerase sigma-70 factor (ECF subfamily)
MCLHAARMPSRVNESGSLSLLPDQDRTQWNAQLIEEGQRLLEHSATGDEVSEYHIEAAIAWCHASAPTAQATNWAQIIDLYDTLLRIRPSPVIALNRAIAVAQHAGPEEGLGAIHAIGASERLRTYPFYQMALGELELQCGRPVIARQHFTAALQLARNPTEQQFMKSRINACKRQI